MPMRTGALGVLLTYDSWGGHIKAGVVEDDLIDDIGKIVPDGEESVTILVTILVELGPVKPDMRL